MRVRIHILERAPFLAVALLVVLAPGIRAQETVNYFGPLDSPLGIRSVGMGETGVADNSDPANVWFNPANVVSRPRAYLHGERWEWVEALEMTTGGGGGSWGNTIGSRRYTFGLDFTAGTLALTDSARTIYLPGRSVNAGNEYYWAVAAGVGTVLGERWETRLGVAVRHFWDEDTAPDPHSGSGFDVGATVAYPATVSGWSVTPAAAIAFVNLGGPLEETSQYELALPARFDYGLSVRVESPHVTVAEASVPLLAFTCNLDGMDRYKGGRERWTFGGELAVAQIFFLRAGAGLNDTDSPYVEDVSAQSAYGVGLGVPFGPILLRFDYARIPILRDPDRFGLLLMYGGL